MEKTAFLERLKELTANEEILSVSSEINELKSKFQDFLTEEERKRQIALLDSSTGSEPQIEGENEEVLIETDAIREEFFNVYNAYREKKTSLVSSQKLEQEANLRLKKKLIERLRNLITEEENIGVAVSTYKEIHEEWKNIGDIPRDKRQDVQNEYSKLLESFFFNLKIYRELKEHDLKRNSQLKNEIVQKIQELSTLDSIKEVESRIKALQNEFDEIGPVVNEEWEQIKAAYWDAVKAVYARIHEFYEGKREELKQNIEKKAALLEEVTAFIQVSKEISSIKEWEENTQKLLEYQNKWKEIGFGSKKENEELWIAFRAVCNEFFEKKKVFFDGLKEGQNKIADAKKKLIERAHALKTSTEWKDTSMALIKLQQDWKNLGHAGQKLEQQLWKDFRGACDSFFNNKQKHFEEADKQNEVNLTIKLDLISKIENYVSGEDKKQILADLRDFSAAFNAVGKVPMKEKDNVYNAYKKAIDGHYSKLKLEGEEKEKAFFQAKMDSMKANPNAEKMIDKERRDLQQQIANLKQEINQFENNLGFFANSKGADALKKEVENKIAFAKRKIEENQRKIKMLVHE
ncbi:MAG: DUF349 domain-containing protein [Flavobacteriia bacterium]|jgi:uncharacterized small protein (DUF1192 family)